MTAILQQCKLGDLEKAFEVDDCPLWIRFGTKPNVIELRESRTFALDEHTSAHLVPDEVDALVLMAHGEGCHLLLGDSVLCSATNISARNCSTGTRCKRAEGHGMPVRFLSELRGRILILLSCNSFAPGGETYPNGFSLVEAASARFDIVIATPFALAYSSRDLSAVLRLLMSSNTANQLLTGVNYVFARPGRSHPFVAIGNPDTAIRHEASASDWTFHRRPAETFWDADDFVDRAHFPTPSGLLSFGSPCSTSSLRNCRQDLVNTADKIAVLAQRERQLSSLLRGPLLDYCDESARQELNQWSSKLRRQLLDLTARFRSAEELGLWSSSIDKLCTQMEHQSRQAFRMLASCMAATLFQNQFGDPVLNATKRLGRIRIQRLSSSCRTCNNPLTLEEIDCLGVWPPMQLAECPICGPSTISVAGEDCPTIKVDEVGPTLRIQYGAEAGPCLILFELRDKAKPSNNRYMTWFVSAKRILSIPRKNLSCDQISLRCVVISERGIGYSRRVYHNV